jgi:transcriptional antiterminator RfaH
VTNLSARWHLVHVNLQEKRKAAWPLTHQWYSIHLPLYLNRWRQARRVGIAGLPFPPIGRMTRRCHSIQSIVRSGDESVYILERMGSVLQEGDRRFGLLDLRPRFAWGGKMRLVYRVFSACLSLFEGLADREQVAILLESLGRKARIGRGEPIAPA